MKEKKHHKYPQWMIPIHGILTMILEVTFQSANSDYDEFMGS